MVSTHKLGRELSRSSSVAEAVQKQFSHSSPVASHEGLPHKKSCRRANVQLPYQSYVEIIFKFLSPCYNNTPNISTHESLGDTPPPFPVACPTTIQNLSIRTYNNMPNVRRLTTHRRLDRQACRRGLAKRHTNSSTLHEHFCHQALNWLRSQAHRSHGPARSPCALVILLACVLR